MLEKKLHPLSLKQIQIEDAFWKEYMELVIPAASEVPVMNTEQHVQSANYSIQKAARDVLV